jgi:hypothetical protein
VRLCSQGCIPGCLARRRRVAQHAQQDQGSLKAQGPVAMQTRTWGLLADSNRSARNSQRAKPRLCAPSAFSVASCRCSVTNVKAVRLRGPRCPARTPLRWLRKAHRMCHSRGGCHRRRVAVVLRAPCGRPDLRRTCWPAGPQPLQGDCRATDPARQAWSCSLFMRSCSAAAVQRALPAGPRDAYGLAWEFSTATQATMARAPERLSLYRPLREVGGVAHIREIGRKASGSG